MHTVWKLKSYIKFALLKRKKETDMGYERKYSETQYNDLFKAWIIIIIILF